MTHPTTRGLFLSGRCLRNIPVEIRRELIAAENPTDLCRRIRKHEAALARLDRGEAHAEFLDCDEAANIMSAVLRAWRVPHCGVVGHSWEGSSHAWVRVGRRNYDPTEQGMLGGKIVERYVPKGGPCV